MVTKKLFSIFLAFFFFGIGLSQEESKPKEKRNGKMRFLLELDMRNSFVRGHPVKFNGLKIGFGNKKHHFGIGFYGTRQPVVSDQYKPDNDTIRNYINYTYRSIFYEYVFFQSKRWQFSVPLHLNSGEVIGYSLRLSDSTSNIILRKVNSMNLSIKGHFKIYRWLGIGSGVGYNYVTTPGTDVKKALSAPFYSLGIKLFLGEVWKLTTSKSYRQSEWTQ